MSGKGNFIYYWEGSDATEGAQFIESYVNNDGVTKAKLYGGIEPGSIGYDSNGAAAGNVYHWNGQAWIATGQTTAGFYGA